MKIYFNILWKFYHDYENCSNYSLLIDVFYVHSKLIFTSENSFFIFRNSKKYIRKKSGFVFFLIYKLMYILLLCSCYSYIFMPSFNCLNDYSFELSKPSVFKQSHQFFESIFDTNPKNKHIENSLYVTKIISIMMR